MPAVASVQEGPKPSQGLELGEGWKFNISQKCHFQHLILCGFKNVKKNLKNFCRRLAQMESDRIFAAALRNNNRSLDREL